MKKGATTSWVINFSRDNQVNTRFEGWKQDHQMMVKVVAQMGNFMSMVTSGEWWKFKKRYQACCWIGEIGIKKGRKP